MEHPCRYVSRVLGTGRTPKYFLAKLVLLVVVVFTMVPLVGVARKILATCTKFNQTSMAGPLGVMLVVPAAAIAIVEQDVDGGPPGGATGSSSISHH
jgi:hypothetical protein